MDLCLKSRMKGLMNWTTKRTMYVRPAKTQVSLCIDPLYKASFLDSPESEEGAYCTISEGSDQNVTLVIPVWTARLSKLNTNTLIRICSCAD